MGDADSSARTAWGSMNTDPEVRAERHVRIDRPRPGTVGFLSQSGALGLAVMSEPTERRGWACRRSSRSGTRPTSPATTCSLLGRGPANRRHPAVPGVLREPHGGSRASPAEIGRRKPIVAVKSGRSAGGARAAGVAHRRAPRAPRTSRWTRCSGRAGVIRTDTLAEMFDVADAARQPAAAAGRPRRRSSRTRVASGSCAPTRARRTG